jgi:D-xylose transport system ATP-binding protein
MPPLEALGITKEFPGVKALIDVNFTLSKGEIHALCGENGAGKSTLMKILAGVYPAGTFSGRVTIDGKDQSFANTAQSRNAGVAVVFQELSLVPEMTVAENIFMGQEPAMFGVLNKQLLNEKARAVLTRIGVQVDPELPVKRLGIGERQMVEIAKALSLDPKILILDEPTSALAEREVARFLEILKALKKDGVSVILVTHKLREVFAVSDRITVLRDGGPVGTVNSKDCDEDQLISMMVGRRIENLYPKSERAVRETVFEVRGLTVDHPRIPHRKLLDDVSWSIRAGEILGIAGLMGSGRTEMLLSIFGALGLKALGQINVAGCPRQIRSPREAMKLGLALASEDRKRLGLILDDPIFQNITLPSLQKFSFAGVINKLSERVLSQEIFSRFKVKAPGVETITKNLSGGNQQKVVLGKCVLTRPKVLFLDEPTRGIDVGARSEIYDWIHKLAGEGLAVVVVSSEMQEVMGLSDRIIVLCEGRITSEFKKGDATEEKILSAATRFERVGLQL